VTPGISAGLRYTHRDERGTARKAGNFIRDIILEHNASERFGGAVITRFPPEPTLSPRRHAKAICIDFGLAQEFGGAAISDSTTQPAKESQEYVDSIVDTVRWLGFDWGRTSTSRATTSSSSTSGRWS